MSEKTGGLIYEAIPAIMSEMGAIARDRKGDTIRYKYRGIDDLYNSLQPLFAKHGVFTVPILEKQERSERASKSGAALFYVVIEMVYRFYAKDGSYFDAKVIGEAMDSGDKAANKAESIAHKYALTQVFVIRTEDESDPDGQVHEVQAGAKRAMPPQQQTEAPQSQFEGVEDAEERDDKLCSPNQAKMIYAKAKAKKIPDDKLKDILIQVSGVRSTNDVPWGDVNKVLNEIAAFRSH